MRRGDGLDQLDQHGAMARPVQPSTSSSSLRSSANADEEAPGA